MQGALPSKDATARSPTGRRGAPLIEALHHRKRSAGLLRAQA